MGSSGSRQKRVTREARPLQAGLWAVFMGVAGLFATFVVVAVLWNDESGAAAVAAVASSIAAILTGYFSIQYSADRRRR